MESSRIRQMFFDFFEGKGHRIVPSAPIVNREDPSLMFTNAGMNQFKDYFLGYAKPDIRRIADTQKCLRVSGKHNDLEEVGVDGYHHTMFEMLGNWSIGDYFKEEAIAWAWELLTEKYGMDKDRMYVTIFEGDPDDNVSLDEEARDIWKRYIPEERILAFGKKDNFWEMGESGPCGPCSEIHYDLRPEHQREQNPGARLVNMDDPGVIEIWNLVFIQYNRKANGLLEELPEKHIDTGMGFERLAQVLQGKTSNYATDIFQPMISFISKVSGIEYTFSYQPDAKTDMAMRVIADHIRAVAFTIADGEIPGNSGAGYVIRRILRRAVRYYYSFLGIEEPLLYRLLPMLSDQFEETFPELKAQVDFVGKVIHEEEKSFLRTLEGGLKKLDGYAPADKVLDGKTAFELYDTYGFPIDLTRLIAREKGWEVDDKGFEAYLKEQKERSRADAQKKVGDWEILMPDTSTSFIGYDELTVTNAHITRMRTVEIKGKDQYQICLDRTPFYPEGGGQVGDTGTLQIAGEEVKVLNTVKELDLVIHIVNKLPEKHHSSISGKVDAEKRELTENNHSATHLLHAALRQVLGDHVSQKGSLVTDGYLRFDFSHFQKVSDEELEKIESIVNRKIRANVPKIEDRNIAIERAKQAGAMMLFGEKYGDQVRMITFDPQYSVELCGGCHVEATGEIGLFKIVSESAVAAGIRRIEAVTAKAAEEYVSNELKLLDEVRKALKNPKDPVAQIASLQDEVRDLQKKMEAMAGSQASALKDELIDKASRIGDVAVLAEALPLGDSKAVKDLIYQIEKELKPAAIVFGFVANDKPQLMIRISEEHAGGDLHAGNIIREAAREMQGGGGGQPFFATAGGKDSSKIAEAVAKAGELIRKATQDA